MTERDWVHCTDPESMLEFLRGKATDRKLRLFACACCRHTAALMAAECRRMTEHKRHPAEIEAARREADLAARAAEIAERPAAGLASLAELKALFSSPDDDEMEGCYADGPDAAWSAKASAYRARWCADYCSPPSYRPGAGFRSSSAADRDRERLSQCGLLRDIFGNPMYAVPIDPTWLTPDVVELAQAIYAERTFDGMPRLADALERAGCTKPAILAHCQGAGEHVRGCWVVDAVLRKE